MPSGIANPSHEPLLADTLRLLLPNPSTTLLLQAALSQDAGAAAAWTRWRSTIGDPKAFLASDRVGIKRHLPLLYQNLTSHRVDVGRDLEPYFRAARAREELRSTRYRRFLGEALASLRDSGVPFVVGRGVTVGETIHPDPVLRHSHDIDLLVQSHDLPAAAKALAAAEFRSSSHPGSRDEHRFDHPSGLPVELHLRLYRSPFYEGGLQGVWSRAREARVVDLPVRVIGDVDLLVHSMVHASSVTQRYGLSWVIDFVTLLNKRHGAGTAIDWTAFGQIANQTRASLPLYVMSNYLHERFSVAIPESTISELRRSAARAGAIQRLAAFDGLRADPACRRIKTVVAASGWTSRAAIARDVLLPPPAYLKAKRLPGPGRPLALLYMTRPLRFVARQLNKVRCRLRQFRVAPAQAAA